MSVFNRRNAIAGWAVWKIAKRMIHRKLRRRQPQPATVVEKVAGRPRSAAAVLVAAGAGLAAFLRLRRGHAA